MENKHSCEVCLTENSISLSQGVNLEWTALLSIDDLLREISMTSDLSQAELGYILFFLWNSLVLAYMLFLGEGDMMGGCEFP